jgi:predicted DNA-binding ribbon-helix-helix protein
MRPLAASSNLQNGCEAAVMKSAIIRRSIRIQGRKTSVSLEKEFWNGLREIALFEKTSVLALVDRINEERDNAAEEEAEGRG